MHVDVGPGSFTGHQRRRFGGSRAGAWLGRQNVMAMAVWNWSLRWRATNMADGGCRCDHDWRAMANISFQRFDA